MPVVLQYGAFQSSPCRLLVVWGRGWARQPWTECLHKWANLAAFQRTGPAGRLTGCFNHTHRHRRTLTESHNKSHNRVQNLTVHWAMLANYQMAEMQKEISLFNSYGNGGHSIPRNFKPRENKSRIWGKTGKNITVHPKYQRQTEEEAFPKTEAVLEKSWCFRLLVSLSAWPGMKAEQRGTAPAKPSRSGPWQAHDRGRERARKMTKSRSKLQWAQILTHTHTLIVPIRCQ